MLIKYLDEKRNRDTRVEFSCDNCNLIYERTIRNWKKMSSSPHYDRDYCRKCWTGVLNRRPEYRAKMVEAIKEMRKRNPDWEKKISETSKRRKINSGDKNGMKQLEARMKVSKARKKMFEDPEVRKHYSEKNRQAWADGKFDGVRVGQCKWHDYTHSNGTLYKVQGNWELAFIKWLDENDLTFTCHRGRIKYKLGEKEKNYYPDFYVEDWGCYVDVKARHFYSEDKFKAIEFHNPDIKVKLLFKEDLLKLGVKL